ncbi:hypothetical protein EAF04_000665 [Stromatinia cepivora]|nr:hypothetical protein EAF04_000665 [Stromatinia cepivora]
MLLTRTLLIATASFTALVAASPLPNTQAKDPVQAGDFEKPVSKAISLSIPEPGLFAKKDKKVLLPANKKPDIPEPGLFAKKDLLPANKKADISEPGLFA